MHSLKSILVLMQAGNWNEAHNLIQTIPTENAAWLHGILHLQEGDLEDAEYWYGKANRNFRERGTLTQELEKIAIALTSNHD